MARDDDGRLICIEKGKKGGRYFCCCPDTHKLKFVSWSGRDDKREFRSYFAHITDKINPQSCRTGGESERHIQAKLLLQETYGRYTFALKKCPDCKTKELWKSPRDGTVVLEQVSEDKKWRYDCVVMVRGEKIMAFEVYATHQTEKNKIDKTRANGLEIAEFLADEVLTRKPGQILKNLLCEIERCNACKTKRVKKRQEYLRRQVEEQKVVAAREEEMKRNLVKMEMFYDWSTERDVILKMDNEKWDIWRPICNRTPTQQTVSRTYPQSPKLLAPITYCRPIPVPSECFDMTPPELWPVYWEEHPEGTELPATVPKPIWDRHWKAKNEKLAETMQPPPPPALWKCYWGKLRGRALTSRKRKTGEEEALPPVFPPKLSTQFWRRYLEMFPEGHKAPPAFDPRPPPMPSGPSPDEQDRYKLIHGSLHVCDRGRWRPSTGCDAWDAGGGWAGAG